MGRSRGITLKGAAAGAFIRAQMGLTPEGDSERALRVATIAPRGRSLRSERS